MRITILATTLFYDASFIQDIKQKLYSHNVCVSSEPILLMLFNMKSIAIAFPQHTNDDNICIINAFYEEVNDLTSAQPCQCIHMGLGSDLFLN